MNPEPTFIVFDHTGACIGKDLTANDILILTRTKAGPSPTMVLYRYPASIGYEQAEHMMLRDRAQEGPPLAGAEECSLLEEEAS